MRSLATLFGRAYWHMSPARPTEVEIVQNPIINPRCLQLTPEAFSAAFSHFVDTYLLPRRPTPLRQRNLVDIFLLPKVAASKDHTGNHRKRLYCRTMQIIPVPMQIAEQPRTFYLAQVLAHAHTHSNAEFILFFHNQTQMLPGREGIARLQNVTQSGKDYLSVHDKRMIDILMTGFITQALGHKGRNLLQAYIYAWHYSQAPEGESVEQTSVRLSEVKYYLQKLTEHGVKLAELFPSKAAESSAASDPVNTPPDGFEALSP